MGDELAARLWKVVSEGVEARRPNYWIRSDFLGLVELTAEIPGIESLELDEVHSAVAMCWLKGGRDGTIWYFRSLADEFIAGGPASIGNKLSEIVELIESSGQVS